MKQHEVLLLENKAWAEEILEGTPDFFEKLAQGQAPDFLWIGCSDSRVSPNEITQSRPGDMFIHRNIANLVVEDDLNLLSVLQFAVEALKIKHVIVCGHYGCGGVQAALKGGTYGNKVDAWIKNIREVYEEHKVVIDTHTTEEERVNALVETNVRVQLTNLANTETIQKAWKGSVAPALHGWVFDMSKGRIKQVAEIESPMAQAKKAS